MLNYDFRLIPKVEVERNSYLSKRLFNLDFGEIKVTHRKFLNSVCLLFVYNNTTRFCVLTVWFGSQHFFNWYWPGDLNQEVRIYKQSLRREMRCGLSLQMVVRITVCTFYEGRSTILHGVQSIFVHLSINIIKEVWKLEKNSIKKRRNI